jgi:phosphoribosylglycinamide formyltransferase 2
MRKIMLLGSGELGRELVISLKRLGQYVVAVDSYNHAPAMQVADEREVINMLSGKSLDKIVEKHKPFMIIPEIEAIRTERFYDYEEKGIIVVPSAKAANYTMNRRSIRDLAADDLKLRTAPYVYANDMESLRYAITSVGYPCVIKPLMSSSGKGQSVVRSEEEVDQAWQYAMDGSRGDVVEVIVEGFIDFHLEITLLTVTTNDGKVFFCPPIGHVQERGDYQESWQPANISRAQLKEAQSMAAQVTMALGGAGIWGVEFFITENEVYFSELSPRPHDTGMVTLAGTQNLSEFDLHARAILGLPIPEIKLVKNGASAVILAADDGFNPEVTGLQEALSFSESDVRIFGKPSTRPYRRMGVALVSGNDFSVEEARDKAKEVAGCIKIK